VILRGDYSVAGKTSAFVIVFYLLAGSLRDLMVFMDGCGPIGFAYFALLTFSRSA